MIIKTIMYIILIVWPIIIIYMLTKKRYKTRNEKLGIIFLGLLWILYLLINFVFKRHM